MKDLFSDRLTIRSVLIGLILIPVNCFWIIQFEFNRWSFPTYLVPYYNVIFCLVLLPDEVYLPRLGTCPL